MMKRDELVVAVYAALIKDCVRYYPDDSSSLQRDFTRLRKATENLGHYFYAVEMPRIGSAFRQCFVTKNSQPLIGVNHCKFMSTPGSYHFPARYPKLFCSLWARIFSEDGGLLPLGPDPRAIQLLSQFFFCFKKLEGACDDHLFQEAIDEFYSQEDRIRPPSLNWQYGEFECNSDLDLVGLDHCNLNPVSDDDKPSTGNAIIDPRLPKTLQHVADVVFGSFPGFNPEEWPCRHGPGSVAEKPRTGDKYVFGSWPKRLDSLFCYDAHATLNADHIGQYDELEHPAKLIAVPKDARGPRLIAAEPSYLQFAQQSINAYLRHEIGHSCVSRSINFVDQGFSQELAVEASITGEYATVDLKSASDMLSLWLVERLVRKNKPLLSAIYHTRSRVIGRDGFAFFLKKVAPMGNAYIFPLQTLVYTLCAISALAVIDGKRLRTRKDIARYAKEVRVFGDDIILPTRAYGGLVQLLTYCGLIVNASKSFAEGNFREACGVDAYAGHNVTPSYVRVVPDATLPESIVSTVEAANNLYEKGLFAAADCLYMRIPSVMRKRIIEVHERSGTFGIRKRYPDHSALRTRYNRALQRLEVLCMVPETGVRVRPVEGIRNLVQYVTERPCPTSGWKSGLRVPLRLKLRLRWVSACQVTT